MPAALAESQASNAFATAEPWTVDRPARWQRPSASDPARVLTAAEFVDHLRSRGARVIDRRGYWMVQCPGHEDHEPSLTARPGERHPVAFYCHGGCSHDDVLAAAGLSWSNVLHRTGTSSFVVRGLVPCDHDHSGFDFEGMSFEQFSLGTAGVLAQLPEIRADLDGKPPLVERDYVEQYVERCVGMFTVSTPKKAGRVMRAVLTDFVTEVNKRRGRGEVRAVPYGSRSVAAKRLGLDPRRLREAKHSLVEAGVLVEQGTFGRTPLYALGVHVRCPEAAGEVEAAAAVVLHD